MAGEDQTHVPFNEQAALAELERLQRALAESRQRRKHATAAFDDFVGSFRKEPAFTSEPAPRYVERRTLSPRFEPPEPLGAPAVPARKTFPKAGLVAGAFVVVAAGVVLTRLWRSPSHPPAPDPNAATAPSTVGSASASPAAARDETAGRMDAELIAVRDVWVRATVDGERAVERELEAGTRVPLRALRSIVIRAGDAGAVRLTIGGEDRGPLGPNGQVITRTFAANAIPGR